MALSQTSKLYSFLGIADSGKHHSGTMRYNCMQSWVESCNPGAWQSQHELNMDSFSVLGISTVLVCTDAVLNNSHTV